MAMLTNNVREWEPLWRSMLPVDEIFELVVDSGFVGCRKPEPRIYELTLERLGVPAEACLFVDDVEVNCEGARKAGMQRRPLPRQRAGDRRDPRGAGLDLSDQQPIASRSTRHAWLILRSDRAVMRRRNDARGTVWTLSKLTTQSVGKPSSVAVSASSGNKVPLCSGKRGHQDRLNPVGDRVSCQDQNGPVATGSRGKPDLTPSHRPSLPSSLPVPNSAIW